MVFHSRFKVLIPVILFSIISCISIPKAYVNKMNKQLDKKMVIFINSEAKKQVVYVPFIGLGSEEYFEKLKDRILKLKSGGYEVYYSAKILPDDELTQEEKDIYLRKYRKVGGLRPQNQKVLQNQYFKMDTPNGEYSTLKDIASIGIDSEEDISVSLTINHLIDLYESEKGEIILTECDFSIPLDAQYDDEVCDQRDSWNVKTGYQLDAMLEAVENSNHDKIALLIDPSLKRFLRIYLKFLHGFDKKLRVNPTVEGGELIMLPKI